MLGGLAKRATYVGQLRRERMNLLLLDTGNLLFPRDSAKNPGTRQTAGLKADLYMKVYNLMGYDAFIPGDLDLSLGIGNLLQMSRQANFPFVAANLVEANSREPVFKPLVIKEFEGFKVGIVGLISDRFRSALPAEDQGKFLITDPVEAGKKAVKTLKKQCRLIIVAAHMEADEQEALAHEASGIHFIVNGHLTRLQTEPILVNHTQILIAGARGEFLGQVDLFKKRKLGFYSRYQIIPVKAAYEEQPEVRAFVSQYQRRYEAARQPVLRAERPAEPGDGDFYIPPLLSFVGDKACQTCHPREYEHWQTTAHARAYQTLADRQKTGDPNCLACHTTGSGFPQEAGHRHENVQCEACHGPGEGHPEPWKEMMDGDEVLCRQCHTPVNTPGFEYGTFVKKILHPR